MRVSCTVLEAFRLWRDPANEWFTEEALQQQILGRFAPTPAMLLGTAFGEVIETPGRFAVDNPLAPGTPAGYQHYQVRDGRRIDTHYFTADTMQPALDLFDYAHGLFEVKAVQRVGTCDIVAKCDYILGSAIGENKTTDSTPNFDKYEASYQWRWMLHVFGAASCTYNVFQLAVDADTGQVRLKDLLRFTLYRYPALEADCLALLDDFIAYVTARGLDRHLRARQSQAADAA